MLLPMKVSRRTQQGAMDDAILGLAIPIGLGLHCLPTIIVEIRRTEHSAAILWVNFIFGWTVLGWIAALIRALAKKNSPKGEPAGPWSAEADASDFHARPLNEDTAICQDDHWVLGIEDFVESLGTGRSGILPQH
jgi:T4 superinfection immunity protein